MMKTINVLAGAAILGLATLFLAGCAGRSKPVRFYVLSPVAATELEKQIVSGGARDVTIGISRVSLPKYLRKPQIVTRTGSNELHLAEHERWAGKIEEDIGRTIAENLGHLLGSDRVIAFPAIAPIAPDYNVKINITRFDGRLGGDIVLAASWAVLDRRGNTVFGVKATQISEPARDQSYAGLVGAQSRVLGAYSRELADVIKKLTDS